MGTIEFRDAAGKAAIEAVPMAERWQTRTVYEMLSDTAARQGSRPGLSFQLKSGPKDRAETLDWTTVHAQVTRLANVLRGLGVEGDETVAYLLPNCTETAITLLAGVTAGKVAPINPLLEVEQIAGILREVNARVVVTLGPTPKADICQKAHAACALAPNVATVLEVDLLRHLDIPVRWIAGLMRPKVERAPQVRTARFTDAVRSAPARLGFTPSDDTDRIAALFHTGGTTGLPKIAQHRQRGMVYNGKVPTVMEIIGPEDVLICPLPLFHVLGAYPILMSCVASGAHFVTPTPQGFRGEGVMDNFWALIERWGVTFMVMVPTAASALMQRPVKNDLSSLKYALCGSAPLPVELFRRFEAACGVKILEGYGMTEATCLVSINPPTGQRKVGSVGLPIPYTDIRILHCDGSGRVGKECGTDEIGEICIGNPAVFPGYAEEARNHGVFTDPGGFLRTGDLGRIDADGYLWITGRAKDLIIRGGHNIDPALIEEALMGHEDVAFVGAIGQPDAYAGELPAAYVELRDGAGVSVEELMAYARDHIPEHAAIPKHLEILDELPKTAVGKVFKPALRKSAISRVYGKALADAGIPAAIEVVEDKTRGLVARVTPAGPAEPEAIGKVLGQFAPPWELAR